MLNKVDKKQKYYIALFLIIVLGFLVRFYFTVQSPYPLGVYSFTTYMNSEFVFENEQYKRDFAQGQSPWLGIVNGRSYYPGMSTHAIYSTLSDLNLKYLYKIPLEIIFVILIVYVVTNLMTKNKMCALFVSALYIIYPFHSFFHKCVFLGAASLAGFIIIYSLINIFIHNKYKYVLLLLISLALLAVSYYTHLIIYVVAITIISAMMLIQRKIDIFIKATFLLILVVFVVISFSYIGVNQNFLITILQKGGNAFFSESQQSFKLNNPVYFLTYISSLLILIIPAIPKFFVLSKDYLFSLLNKITMDKKDMFLFSWLIAFGIEAIAFYIFANDPLRAFEFSIIPFGILTFYSFQKLNITWKGYMVYFMVIFSLFAILVHTPVQKLQTFYPWESNTLDYINSTIPVQEAYTDLRFGGLINAYLGNIDVKGLSNNENDATILFYQNDTEKIYSFFQKHNIHYLLMTNAMQNYGIYSLNFPYVAVKNKGSYDESNKFDKIYQSKDVIFKLGE